MLEATREFFSWIRKTMLACYFKSYGNTKQQLHVTAWTLKIGATATNNIKRWKYCFHDLSKDIEKKRARDVSLLSENDNKKRIHFDKEKTKTFYIRIQISSIHCHPDSEYLKKL